MRVKAYDSVENFTTSFPDVVRVLANHNILLEVAYNETGVYFILCSAARAFSTQFECV